MPSQRANAILLSIMVASLALASVIVVSEPALPDAKAPAAANEAPATLEDARAAVAEARFSPGALRFEPNMGQAPSDVVALALAGGSGVWFDRHGMTAWVPTEEGQPAARLRIAFEGGAATPFLEGPTGAVSHYYGDSVVESVPHHTSLRYDDVWPGIDLVAYVAPDGRLEFDHVVAPGADASQVRLRLEDEAVLEEGRVVARAGGATIAIEAPVVYQELDGVRQPVAGAYELDEGVLSYRLGEFDAARALVIDPLFSFSTYLGMSSTDFVYDLDLREVSSTSKHIHVAGAMINGAVAFPPGFATTQSFGNAPTSSYQPFVAKYDYNPTTRTATGVWFTFMFSNVGSTYFWGLDVDTNGNVAMAGYTTSTGWATQNPVMGTSSTTPPNYNGGVSQTGQDAIAATVNSAGVRQFATYLGASSTDTGRDVAWRSDGTIVVVGSTTQSTSGTVYPTQNAFQSSTGYPSGTDMFISVINPSASPAAFVWSTLLGGGGNSEEANVVETQGLNVWVAGRASTTTTAYFSQIPTTAGTFQPNPPGAITGTHGVIHKFTGAGALEYGTFLTSSGTSTTTTQVFSMLLDTLGRPWVTGQTSAGDFPACNNPFNPINPCTATVPYAVSAGGTDIFVTQLSSTLSNVLWSTYLGSGTTDYSQDIARDPVNGEIVIAGRSSSSTPAFPLTANAADNTFSGTDAIIARFNPTLSGLAALTMSSLLGGSGTDYGDGIGVDSMGNMYVGGYMSSGTSFPLVNQIQSTASGQEGYVTVLAKRPPTATIRATPNGFPAVLSPPSTTVTTPAGNPVALLDVTVLGDYPINAAQTRWRLLDGTGAIGSGATLQTIFGTTTPSFSGLPLMSIGTRDVCLQVTDTDTRDPLWSSNERCMRINWSNAVPNAINDIASVDEDSGVNTIDVLANDVDDDALTISNLNTGGLMPPLSTAFSIGPGATSIRFTTVPDHHTMPGVPLVVTYTARDPLGQTDTATLTLTVNPVNDAPVGMDDWATIEEGIPTPINVLGNDHSGPDTAETLVVSSIAGGLGNIVIDAGGAGITYTSAPGFLGTDTFTYAVQDPGGLDDTATVTVNVTTAGNGPRAFPETLAVMEDSSNNVLDVLLNDWRPIAGTSINAVGTPSKGIVQIASDALSLTYTPHPNAEGPDAFSYRITDGTLESTTTVTVNINALNDPPTAVADSANMVEDGGTLAIAVLANDLVAPDLVDVLQVVSVGTATSGSAAVGLGGLNVLYTPAQDFAGTDSFTYTIIDQGGLTSSATVTVQVSPVNDAPVAVDDGPIIVLPEVPLQTVEVLANDIDVDTPASQLRIISASIPPGDGTLSVDASVRLVYTPPPGRLGAIQVTYAIRDGVLSSAPATVHLDIGLPSTPFVRLTGPVSTCVNAPANLRALAVHAGYQADRWTWTATGLTLAPRDRVAHFDDLVAIFTNPGPVQVTVRARLTSTSDPALTQELTEQLSFSVLRCQAPTADFRSSASGLTVHFQDLSVDADGTIAGWLWDFGDGTTSAEQHPLHAYAQPGPYTVTLTAWDDEGTSAVAVRTAVAGGGLDASGGGRVAGGVRADSGGAGDPGAGLGATPQAPALPPDPNNLRPIARIDAPAAVRGGDEVRLDASGSHDPDGDAITWRWRQVAGPDVPLSGLGTVVGFRAPEGPLTLQFEIEVADAHGSSTATATIVVGAPTGPVAAFQVLREEGAPTVAFGDASIARPGAQLVWMFGDGAMSRERHPTHTYSRPGTYTVTLRVLDDTGYSEIQQSIHVEGEVVLDNSVGLDDEGRDLEPRAADGGLPKAAWVILSVLGGFVLIGAALSGGFMVGRK